MSVPRTRTETPGRETGGQTSEGRGSRRRLAPEQRKDEVTEVAARVFAEKGYRAASITDIVERAGIGRGTFYLYFDSKKELFLELIERYFSDFATLLEGNQRRLAEAIESGGVAVEVWRSNMLRILEYHYERPELTSVIYRDAIGTDEHFSARVEELTKIARRELRKDFELMQKTGLLRRGNLDVITNVILGSAIYVILENVARADKPDLEAIADEMVTYHVRALMRDELTGLVREGAPWAPSGDKGTDGSQNKEE